MQLFALALNFFFVDSDGQGHRIALLIRLNANILLFPIFAFNSWEKKASIICQHEKFWPLVKFIKDRLTSTALQPFPSIHTEKAQEAETLFAWAKSCTL